MILDALSTPTEPEARKVFAPAVDPKTRVVNYTSVSQLQRAKRCSRSWWFRYVLKLAEEQTSQQALGVEGHRQLAHYLKTGEDVLGDIARAGKEHLPEPGAGLEIEQTFGIDLETGKQITPWSIAGIPLTGAMDVVNLREFGASGIVGLDDHKFTSDVNKYASTPDDLVDPETEHGIQMLGYGKAQIERFGDRLRTIWFRHIYYQTRGKKKALPVRNARPAEIVLDLWNEKIEPLGVLLKTIARETNQDNVPANPGEACFKYRKTCAFAAECNAFSKADALADLDDVDPQFPDEGAEPVSLLASILKTAPAATPAGKEEPAHTPAAAEVVPSGNVDSGSKPAEIALSVPQDTPVPVVVPPDAPKSDPAKAARDPEPPAPAEEEKPKRKRRTKAEIEADEAKANPVKIVLEEPTIVQAPPEVQASRFDPADVAKAEAAPTLRVYVDAVPNGGEAKSLDEYVFAIKREIETRFEAHDIQIAPNKLKNGSDSPIAFGKWKGALAAKVRQSPPPPGTYVLIAKDSELRNVVAEALAEVCRPGDFVRGVR